MANRENVLVNSQLGKILKFIDIFLIYNSFWKPLLIAKDNSASSEKLNLNSIQNRMKNNSDEWQDPGQQRDV